MLLAAKSQASTDIEMNMEAIRMVTARSADHALKGKFCSIILGFLCHQRNSIVRCMEEEEKMEIYVALLNISVLIAGIGDEEGSTVSMGKASEEKAVADSKKPICSETSRRSNVCEAEGDIRVKGSSQTIFLHPSLTSQEWKIKPYARKHDQAAIAHVKEWTIKSFT